MRSVDVMGAGRAYDHVLAPRAVTSSDGMTADFHAFPHDFLARVATRIINQVRGINRVVCGVTSRVRRDRVGAGRRLFYAGGLG